MGPWWSRPSRTCFFMAGVFMTGGTRFVDIAHAEPPVVARRTVGGTAAVGGEPPLDGDDTNSILTNPVP